MAHAAAQRILLTGGSGQVGRCLIDIAPKNWEVVAPSHAQMDIADPAQVEAALAAGGFTAVVSSAAYTAVDKAEDDVAACWRANALGPAVLASAAARADIPIIHLSTDYVFDGSKIGAYLEDDPVGPLGVYGASKEGGEQAVRTANPRHVILRTAWVVSPYGANFVKTMLRLGADRPLLRIVGDQHGCPTCAPDIAQALVAIGARLAEPDAPSGTYQFVNDGEASWFELAQAVFEMAGLEPSPRLEAIATADYPTRARRPANSRLSTAKLQRDFGVSPRPWRIALRETVERLAPSHTVSGVS